MTAMKVRESDVGAGRAEAVMKELLMMQQSAVNPPVAVGDDAHKSKEPGSTDESLKLGKERKIDSYYRWFIHSPLL